MDAIYVIEGRCVEEIEPDLGYIARRQERGRAEAGRGEASELMDTFSERGR
jgi:hypothetical protein